MPRLKRCVTLLVVAVATVAASVATVPGAAASTGSNAWQKAQAGLAYTVYEPTRTLGLKQTAFRFYDLCGPGRNRMLSATFSSASGRTRSIGLGEYPKPCADGPDGVGPAATFTSHGVTVHVAGACAGNASTCAKASPAGVQRTGYVTFTLPAGSAGHTSTYIELYTSGVPVAQIKAFVDGLTAVH